MDEIGQVSWKQFEKFLFAVGCKFASQESSHRKYKKAGLRRSIIVPRRDRLPTHVILNNLRTLGVSKEDFIRMMKDL